MSCKNCTEIFNCGTVEKFMRDCSRDEFKKNISQEIDCIDFNEFSGDIKAHYKRAIEIADDRRKSLKRVKK
jgi:hypothetical protein